MLHKHKVRILPFLFVVAIIAATAVVNVSRAAGSITVMSDVMTNQSISVDSDHTISFTVGTALVNNDGILVTFDPAGQTFDLTGVTTSDFNFTCATGIMTTATKTINTTADTIGLQIADINTCSGAITLSITGANKINNPGTSGSKTIKVETYDLGADGAFGGTSTNADTLIDTGSLAVAILASGDVTISATVDPTITFAILNATDNSTTTNNCSLGTLSTSSVSTCAYRLGVATNATNGYSVYLSANHNLQDATSDVVANVGEAVVGASAGVEGYGIALNPATNCADSSVGCLAAFTALGNFATNDSTVPTTQTLLLSADKPTVYGTGTGTCSGSVACTTTTHLVTHRAQVSSLTPAGSYSQTVTYTVVGNF